MKNHLLAFLLALAPISALAATSTVTATVTDTDGQVWSNGTWTAKILMPGGQFSGTKPTIGGVPVPDSLSGVMNSSGVLTASLTDTSSLDQSGVQWTVRVCPNASISPYGTTDCFSWSGPIVGGSVSLTSKFSSVTAPRFPAGLGAFGYTDGEVFTPSVVGSSYFNTSTTPGLAGLRLWDGNRWVAGSSSGGGITALTGDVTASGPGSAAATLANTTVTPGSYTNANVTVDAKGRVTAAANGPGGGISGLTTNFFPKATSSTAIGNSLLSEISSALRYTGTLINFGASADCATLNPSQNPYFNTCKAVTLSDYFHDINTQSKVTADASNHAFASYDCRISMLGAGGSTADHFACYQGIPSTDSTFAGTLSRQIALVGYPYVAGGTVTGAYNFYSGNAVKTGGTLGTHYGFFSETLNQGTVAVNGSANWFLYGGANPSLLQGQMRILFSASGSSDQIRLSNSAANGYTNIRGDDSSGTQTWAFGYGNSGVAGIFSDKTFMYSASKAFCLSVDATTCALGISTSGRYTFPANGALSSPVAFWTGTWPTGGTATTTKPMLLVEPTGTTSTGWGTAGTGIGVNAAPASTANLIDLQVAGVSKFKVGATGGVTVNSGSAQATYSIASTGAGAFTGVYAANTDADYILGNLSNTSGKQQVAWRLASNKLYLSLLTDGGVWNYDIGSFDLGAGAGSFAIDNNGDFSALGFSTSVNAVAFSDTPAFNSVNGMAEITLTGNVTSWTLANPADTTKAFRKCITWTQDATGGRTVSGTPSNVKSAAAVGTNPSTSSVQCWNWSPTRSAYLAEGVSNQ